MQSSIISFSKELRDIFLIFAYCYLLWVHILLLLCQGSNLGLISHKENSFAYGISQGGNLDHFQCYSNILRFSFLILCGPSIRSQTQNQNILSSGILTFLTYKPFLFIENLGV